MVPRSRRYSLQIHTTLTPRSVQVASASGITTLPERAGDGWSHEGSFVRVSLTGLPAKLIMDW